MTTSRSVAITFLAALLTGCPPEEAPTRDAGVRADAGVSADAGSLADAGTSLDAGRVDAGTSLDAGRVDAGALLDAGRVDAGGLADAGRVDAGVMDAGRADAGTDAGRADAGRDAGRADAGTDAGRDAGTDAGRDAGPPDDGELSDVLTGALWEELFPNRNALYEYDALIEAASYYPDFAATGTTEQRRRELAAFLANISHETTGGWATAPGGPYAWGLYFVQEVGCESGGCTGYCDASNTEFPCVPGRTYHGRGPIQLSWNYNYGLMGRELGVDLLNDPDRIIRDGVLAFRSALWFWMTTQLPKPSAHDVMTGQWTPSASDASLNRLPGFGMTINIINGRLECGWARSDSVSDRMGYFARFTSILGVSQGPNLDCDDMAPY